MERIRAWIRVASDRSVLRRALVSCLVVGVVLTIVNHGPQLLRGELTAARAVQIAITLLVPFIVSITSSVAALRGHAAIAPDPRADDRALR